MVLSTTSPTVCARLQRISKPRHLCFMLDLIEQKSPRGLAAQLFIPDLYGLGFFIYICDGNIYFIFFDTIFYPQHVNVEDNLYFCRWYQKIIIWNILILRPSTLRR